MQVTIAPSLCNKVEIIKWFRRLTIAAFGKPFPLRTCLQIMKQLELNENIVFDVPDTDAVMAVLYDEDFENVTFTKNHPKGWINLAAIYYDIQNDVSEPGY